MEELSREYFTTVPHTSASGYRPGSTVDTWTKLEEEVELCQLLIDLLEVHSFSLSFLPPFVLFCFVLFCFVLFCFVLFCFVLFCKIN